MAYESTDSKETGQNVAPLGEGNPALYDVYDFISWAQTFRAHLIGHSSLTSGPGETSGIREATSEKPGPWEEKLLQGRIAIRKRSLLRLLNWNFSDKQSMLVSLCEAGEFEFGAVSLGEVLSNRYIKPLCDRASEILGDLSAGIVGHPDIFFHPRFCGADRRPYLVALANWWHKLANQIPVLHLGERLKPESRRFDRGPSSDAVVQILNTLLIAACSKGDVLRYSLMLGRWRVPANLKQRLKPDEVLPVVGSYLASLNTSEQEFVLDLLNDPGNYAPCR